MPLSHRFEELRRDYAAQNTQWTHAQAALAALPPNVHFLIPDALFETIDQSAMLARAPHSLCQPHCLRA